MSHFCKVCGASKPNEAFSGKGHRTHICKECASLPKVERDSIEQEEEIVEFLRQSHISPKNIDRLQTLTQSTIPHIAEMADIVLQIALIKPFKTRRLKVLAKDHTELYLRLIDTGLIEAHHH
jgi:hypothetical protein